MSDAMAIDVSSWDDAVQLLRTAPVPIPTGCTDREAEIAANAARFIKDCAIVMIGQLRD